MSSANDVGLAELRDAAHQSRADDGLERTSLVGQSLEEYLPFPLPIGPLPDATPAQGSDPYGNADPEWLRVDWGEHLCWVELESVPGVDVRRPGPTRVNYVEMGTGEPTLLFVHGLSGSWQNWLENIPRFARSTRVVALDLPGFGHSPLPPWTVSVEAYGRLLHAFCDALDVGDCAVVGNSMGGFVSAEAASREPGRFEKLVLVGAAGVSHARMRRQPVETAARMAAAAAPLLTRWSDRGLSRARLRHATFRGIFHRPQWLRRELLHEQFANGAGRPGFLPAVQGLVGYDFLDRLEDVDVPTLIVWGRNDRVVPATDALAYARHLRNSTLVIFDQTGHCPQLERPVRFNRLLEAFLSR